MKMFLVTAALASALPFCGCAAYAQGEPAAPKKPHTYLPVEELPKHEQPAMTNDERANLVKDLAAARDRQTARSKESVKPAKP
jgi:hypothetical protein